MPPFPPTSTSDVLARDVVHLAARSNTLGVGHLAAWCRHEPHIDTSAHRFTMTPSMFKVDHIDPLTFNVAGPRCQQCELVLAFLEANFPMRLTEVMETVARTSYSTTLLRDLLPHARRALGFQPPAIEGTRE